jgi:2-polyprenyl-6-methoxyphenol hydroxylase-like FAD-dependent oxidoreductase
MARGRVALAGDAAHAASPMVGGGFRQGLYDAATLSAAVEKGGVLVVQDVLDSYERQRLAPARAHVERSKEATEHYLERRGS